MPSLTKLIQQFPIPLRWKLLASFLAASLLLLIALGLALSVLFGTTEALKSLKQSTKRDQQVKQLELAQNKLVINALDSVWSGKLARIDEYSLAQQQLDRLLNDFQPSSIQNANYLSLREELGKLTQVLDRMIALSNEQKNDEIILLWRTEGAKQANLSASLIQELSRQETHQALVNYALTLDEAAYSTWWIASLALLALLVATSLSLLLTGAFTGPISQLRKGLAELAGGDLRHSIQIVNRDELGELGLTFNTTVAALRQLVRQLYFQGQQISSAIAELNFEAKSQVSGSSQQVSAVAEISQALQELHRTAEEITSQVANSTEMVDHSLAQAQAVNVLADQAVFSQEQGRSVVARALVAMHNLKEQVALIEAQHQTLVLRTTSIAQIVTLIDNVAQETHLLSLNAAIEAAGAGALGGRFAAVASEVKRLASNSLKATQEVKAVLGGISQGVKQVSQCIDQGLQQAEQAVEEASQADKILVRLTELSVQVKMAGQQITGKVQGTAALANSIGSATRQQQLANQQMVEKMLEIETVASQTLSSVKQGEAATQQLSLIARELEYSARAFKMGTA